MYIKKGQSKCKRQNSEWIDITFCGLKRSNKNSDLLIPDSTNVKYVSRTFNSLSSMRKWLRNKALKWIWYINYIYYGTMKILNYFSHFIRIPSFHYNYILKSYFFDFHKKISHNVKGLINSKSLHFPLYQDPLVRRFQRTHQNLIWNLARKKTFRLIKFDKNDSISNFIRILSKEDHILTSYNFFDYINSQKKLDYRSSVIKRTSFPTLTGSSHTSFGKIPPDASSRVEPGFQINLQLNYSQLTSLLPYQAKVNLQNGLIFRRYITLHHSGCH